MSSRNVLLTGGAGYIGSHTAKALASMNFYPVVLDNLCSGNQWAVQWGPLIQGDIADRQLVSRTIQKYNIGAVIHLAASAYVGESIKNPRKYFENNVSKSLQFFDTLLDSGIDKVIFSSSCATYGLPQSPAIREDHPQNPISPYGESKLFIERACRWYDQAYGLRTITLRYFNAAGADPDGQIGESHHPETHLIPLVIKAALSRGEVIEINGTQFSTPDGTAVRDFIHVTDVAKAHVSALQHLITHGVSSCLNLGTGSGSSVLDVVRVVEEMTGAKIECRKSPARPGDAPVLIASANAARDVLGWVPTQSSLKEIVSTALTWHSSERGQGIVSNHLVGTR